MSAISEPSTLSRIASALTRPAAFLATIIFATSAGLATGQAWASALFWSLSILIAAAALIALAGARPLPKVADQSHLMTRVSWLGRYGTGALLLCISTFLGGLAGTMIPGASAQESVAAMTSLIEQVALHALRVAITIMLVWLSVDVARLGAAGRREGFARATAWLAGPLAESAARKNVAAQWISALTSPVLVAFVALIGLVAMLSQNSMQP